MEPITWRNVQSNQNLGGVARLMENGNQGIQNMLSGLRDAGNEIVGNRVDANRRDLQQYMDSFQSPEEYQAALDSGAFQERINTYGGYVDDSFAGMPQSGLQTSRDRVMADAEYQDWVAQRPREQLEREREQAQADVQYQDWVRQQDNRDLRKQIAEADSRTALSLLEQNRDALGEEFYTQQITARRGEVQSLNALEAERYALSPQRIRDHVYGIRFSDDAPDAVKQGTGFTSKQKEDEYNKLSSAPIGSLSKGERDRLGTLIQEMTGNASFEQYQQQTLADLDAQVQSGAITPGQYQAMQTRLNQEFELMDQEGYLDSPDLKAAFKQADELALKTSGSRTNLPIKDNMWYQASKGETITADAALSRLVSTVNKGRDEDDHIGADNMVRVNEALQLLTTVGISDGSGNRTTLPLTNGIVDLVASGFEEEKWFSTETNGGPEELARAILTSLGGADAYADYRDYDTNRKRTRKQLRQAHGEVNQGKQAQNAYFKRLATRRATPSPTSSTGTLPQPKPKPHSAQLVALQKEADLINKQDRKMTNDIQQGKAVSIEDLERLRKARESFQQNRNQVRKDQLDENLRRRLQQLDNFQQLSESVRR